MRFIFLIGFVFSCWSELGFSQPNKSLSLELVEMITELENHLFPLSDPMHGIYDLSSAQVIYSRMKSRKQSDGTFKPSPLAEVSDALNLFYARQRNLDERLVLSVLLDSRELIKKRRVEKIDLQSNLLSLKFLLDYLQRFEEPFNLDRDGDSTSTKEQKSENKEVGPKVKQYPKLPKNYEAHTKDTKKEKKGSKDDQFLVAEVNFATPYFGQVYFSDIYLSKGRTVQFKEVELQRSFASPAKLKNSNKLMLVKTFGEKELDLFLPPSYQILQATDPRAYITRSKTGVYKLSLTEKVESLVIPLRESEREFLNPVALEIYTRPIGLGYQELQASMRSLFSKFDPNIDHSHQVLTIAGAIAREISNTYLYSVGAREEKDPIEALKAGAFQCDMATSIMIGILRDIYKIPSRAVAGFRGKQFKNGADQKTYLVMPGEAHVWVEVYEAGIWHAFDPTPLRKDQKKSENQEDGEKDEYSERSLDDPTLKEEGFGSDGTTDLKSKNEGEKTESSPSSDLAAKTHVEKLQNATNERLKNLNQTTTNSTHKEDEVLEMDQDQLAGLLELGSLELEQKPNRNPFRDRVARLLLRYILNPKYNSQEIMNLLHKAKSFFSSFDNIEIRELFKSALMVHESSHENLFAWLQANENPSLKKDLASYYYELYLIKKAAEVYRAVLDENQHPLLHELSILIYKITSILEEINRFTHPDSAKIAKVQAFYKPLPPIVRQLLKVKYNLELVGQNTPTLTLFDLLKNGQLKDLRLLGILSPLSEFVLNSIPRPEYQAVKSWIKDSTVPMGRDFLPAQRFSELSQSFFLEPGRSPEENFLMNKAMISVRRKRIFLPTGRGEDDVERITVVLYDTSGSMYGEPARFQAGLISAFVSKALSDLSPSGHHRHRVVLVPFDDNPGKPTMITNTHEALEVLHNYVSNLQNTRGGTDIQKAMVQALALIADAEKRKGEPLAAANIILMTDGESAIDLDDLIAKRQAIHRETPIQTMFIAIGATNEKLIKFAEDSRDRGLGGGFYREYTTAHMTEILAEADNVSDKIDDGFIYTEHTARDLSPSIYKNMREALLAGANILTLTKSIYIYDSAAKHLDKMETIPWNLDPCPERKLLDYLMRLRGSMRNPIFKQNREILQYVVNDLMIHIERLSGLTLSQFCGEEQEHLRHLLRFSAGIEDEAL